MNRDDDQAIHDLAIGVAIYDTILRKTLPAGQESFFLEGGVPVATRKTSPPKVDEK